jgi:UDP-N-acetylenolpyruvoylglucosamine reductase
MDEKLKLISQTIGEERFKYNESLNIHTFSKSEGKAECFFIATSLAELVQILDMAHDLHLPYFLIGAGTKVILSKDLKNLVVKNRTSTIKVAGVKGKVGVGGIGVEEAFIEADSGVSLKKLNEFVKKEKLQEITGFSSINSTVGGSIFLDPLLRSATQSLRVWNEGEVLEIKLDKLKRSMVVLSVIFKFKAKG